MPAYGKVKVDTITYDLSGTATDVSVSNIATKASPTFTGTVTIPTATAGDNSTKAASTAFVVASFATKASPTFTGTINAADLVLSGDLTVNGSTTTIDTTTLQVEDKNIQIGKVSTPSDVTADGGGLTLLGATNKTWNWVNSTDAWTSSEHIHLGDNKKLLVGDGSDLEIYHDTNNSRIADNGTGKLYLTASAVLLGNAAGNESLAEFTENGSCTLRHDNNVRVTTTATGCSINGTLAATAVTGDGSGLTNLPPAGNTVDLVADGAIGAGKPVIIKSNGKVEQVKQVVVESSTQSSYPAQGGDGQLLASNPYTIDNKGATVMFSTTSNVGGFFYSEKSGSQRLMAQDFNINAAGNANRPSAGDIQMQSFRCENPKACWDSTNNKACVVYRKDSNNTSKFTYADVTPSGSRYIVASGQELDIYNTSTAYEPRICDCKSNRILAITNSESTWKIGYQLFYWNGSQYAAANSGNASPSGNSSGSQEKCGQIAYHTAEGKAILVYQSVANTGVCSIGTLSGSNATTDISWGTGVQFTSDNVKHVQIVVDDNTGKVVIIWKNEGSNSVYKSIVGTISGTSISFGTAVDVDAAVAVDGGNWKDEWHTSAVYVQNLQKILFTWVHTNGSNYITYTKTGTVSGTSISWANLFRHYAIGVGIRSLALADLNDSATNKVVMVGRNDSDNDNGHYKTIALSTATTNVDYLNCIGFAPLAISDGNTGTINLDGNTVDNQSGLTAATRYYVQADGSLGTSQFQGAGGTNIKSGGMALSATKLLVRATYAE
jgi:hypothetical protein